MKFSPRQISVESVQLENCVRTYHCSQILERIMNNYLMTLIVPALISLGPLLQIVSQYVVITMHDVIEMPAFLVFPLIIVNCLIMNICIFTVASWVYNRSTRTLMKMRNECTVKGNIEQKRRSILRRVTNGSFALKIKFGSNFIESRTPLKIQDFCMTQTMSLILINA